MWKYYTTVDLLSNEVPPKGLGTGQSEEPNNALPQSTYQVMNMLLLFNAQKKEARKPRKHNQ
jgi:hypothetical protein